MKTPETATFTVTRPRPNIANIIGEYGRQLFAFIRGRVRSDEDTEDILQDVWYTLSSQEELETIDQVGAWLYKVARNKIIDKHRKKSTLSIEDVLVPDEEGIADLGSILLADADTPETMQLKELFWDTLQEALDELPAAQRDVFVRNELKDETLQEIADSSGENLKTIISRKRYAVMHLRERLSILHNELSEISNTKQ